MAGPGREYQWFDVDSDELDVDGEVSDDEDSEEEEEEEEEEDETGISMLDLRMGGHIIVGMEIPINLPTWFQIIGQVFRIDYKFSQQIYLLWTYHTYDQVALHKITKKEHAEKLLVSFMGFEHSPYPAPLGSTDYDKKDKYISKFEKDQHNDEIDEEEIPSTLEFVGQGVVTPRKSASTNVTREKPRDSPSKLPQYTSHDETDDSGVTAPQRSQSPADSKLSRSGTPVTPRDAGPTASDDSS
ncbi:hypothetical protein F5884DRAFT_861697 [Xylogone sp. PMI_703]|nr:hypothetical protein F5884DRAFT_861697 [Xylogone sp. PMI_703]